MRTFIPMFVNAAFVFWVSLGISKGLRTLHTRWWKYRYVRLAVRLLPALSIFFNTCWAIAAAMNATEFMSVSAVVSTLVSLFALAIFFALPLTSLAHWIEDRLEARVSKHTPEGESLNLSRRRFLRTTAVAFPAMFMTASASGFAQAFGEIRIPEIPLQFKHLPEGLRGLKILHFSDFHVGYYIQLHDVAKLLTRVADLKADLVLVTGDLADRLNLLPELLEMLASLKPPLGVFASLGNHEYFRGIKTVRKSFAAGPVPLLCNEGARLSWNGSSIYLGGADDPQRMIRRDMPEFFEASIDAAMADAPSEAFKILMSHRPTGFTHAAHLGIDLTLSGHTHGMQIGLNGRSLFENWAPDKFLWGHYERGASQLYTSSGAGHWFPVRLGCPPEAPLFILQRSEEAV